MRRVEGTRKSMRDLAHGWVIESTLSEQRARDLVSKGMHSGE
jgi:hypothetical protein